MTNHLAQPALCADCLTVAQSLAEAGPPNDRVIKLCTHGADGAVFAVAAKRDGAIVNWHLEGPLTDEQADVVAAKVLAQFVAAGMVHHEITRQ